MMFKMETEQGNNCSPIIKGNQGRLSRENVGDAPCDPSHVELIGCKGISLIGHVLPRLPLVCSFFIL